MASLSEHKSEQTPGDCERQASLARCGPGGRKASDVTYRLNDEKPRLRNVPHRNLLLYPREVRYRSHPQATRGLQEGRVRGSPLHPPTGLEGRWSLVSAQQALVCFEPRAVISMSQLRLPSLSTLHGAAGAANLFSDRLGCWKSKIQVTAGLIPPESSSACQWPLLK